MPMDVYTVHVDYHNERARAATRIVKRRVVKTGTAYLTLSAAYVQGDTIKVPIDQCYSSLEQARAGLAVKVAEKLTELNLRIEELKQEPTIVESYAVKEDVREF